MISGISMSWLANAAQAGLSGFHCNRWILMLAGAVNTAIIGSNGVLNRVAKTVC